MTIHGGAVLRDRPALRRCVAVPPQRFADAFWDRDPLLSKAAELPSDFSDLLDLDAVDDLLSRRGVRTPFVRLARDGRIIETAAWTGPGGVGARIADQVIDDRVLREVADGATVVLQGLHRLWPPVIEFAQQLSADLGHPVQVNAYITPPQAQGFDDHYDTHDVFVLALAGRKRWRIRPPVVSRPATDDPWTEHTSEVRAAASAEPIIDEVLEPGDTLYLPRGFLHSAVALGETCAHLTVGIHPVTGRDIARLLLAELPKQSALGAALPIGAIDDPELLTAEIGAVVARVRELAITALADVDISAVSASLSQRMSADVRPEPIRPLAQSDAARQVSVDDRIRLRRGLRVGYEVVGGELVVLAGVATVRILAARQSAIDVLLDGEPHRVGDLPAAAGESVELARLLLREGVVVPVRA